jgi:hypothetical protein
MAVEISYGNARESVLSLLIRLTTSTLRICDKGYRQAYSMVKEVIITRGFVHKSKIWREVVES